MKKAIIVLALGLFTIGASVAFGSSTTSETKACDPSIQQC